ncbi:helix-turn-helix transcriptional regulator [Rhodopseudomonas palustris]|uniref:helix-turn-helix transcriptional regulator n=1 Tax=Rhodopseudomonas palustris TaxID=1076 RepID=UPI0018DCD421|nr:AraC family transcriptional regulator [Rhodopseudomonas palustris]
MQRVVYSAHDLSPGLDDQARFSRWRDIYTASFLQSGNVVRLSDRPFAATWEHAQIGDSLVARFEGTLQRVSRDAQQVAAHPVDRFCISYNRASSRQAMVQRGRELTLEPGTPAFFNLSEMLDCRSEHGEARIGFTLPRKTLLDSIPHAEDLVLRPLDPGDDALLHLRWYLDFLLERDGAALDPAMVAHVQSVLIDLLGLALGVGRDLAEASKLRGLRAVRFMTIVAEIGAGFADPGFSAARLAAKLNLSSRYIQDILHESGVTLTERVLELRLQKARRLLASGLSPALKVTDIALSCGFSDVSHFNHSFRRRFGASPTQFRPPRIN